MKQTLPYHHLFRQRLREYPHFSRFLSHIQDPSGAIAVSGLAYSSLSLFVYALFSDLSVPMFVVFPDEREAERVRDDLEFLIGSPLVAFLPDPNRHKDPVFDSPKFGTIFYDDFLSKHSIARPFITILTEGALTAPLPNPDDLVHTHISLKTGSSLQRDGLLGSLASWNYERVDTVEYPLEYSVRGSILDVFPSTYPLPFRIEFFGDQIESIRSFRPDTQTSVKKVGSFDIVSSGGASKDNSASLFSYFSPESLLFLPHADTTKLSRTMEIPDTVRQIHLVDVSGADYSFPFYPLDIRPRNLTDFRKYLLSQQAQHPSADFLIISDHAAQVNRLRSLFQDVPVTVQEGYLSHSLICPDLQVFLFSDNDIFSRQYKSKTFSSLSLDFSTQKIDQESISHGDIMVHIHYGIGKYTGLRKVTAFGAERECLTLEYRGGDKVMVPVDRLRDVQKYQSGDAFSPVLSKLGSVEWEKTKLRTKNSVNEITKALIGLYAERIQSDGFAFNTDSSLQAAMEAEFIYDETPDQLTATKEIVSDMQKSVPMDRLLCGDVGFGKTEVAMRAAFLAVSNSKQVAVLVPTTILADQHYDTFCTRLKNFPVRISLLSRFVPKQKQKQSISQLQNGHTDIIIGTHRLLSKDIKFSDLGLLIIDEEHRFGVTHKEKIKKLRTQVDVLSLSATPIPRTLQFSLMGARDFSHIHTPPKSRLPILTEIITFDKNIIRSAVLREMDRGGQVYFVHNEIKSIASIAGKLQDLFPDLIIRFAHGQMRENEIEPIMRDFIHAKIHILVCTSIIESGIDIPNVNTIFIHRAHRFGLAQLYQLRGRVGRGNRRAYCYLIVSNPHRLQPDAIKRLQTIRRFTSLGSGFSIAQKDLEIRGSGNVFGVEQSGNIQAVGYDLYMKILQVAVSDLKASLSADDIIPKPKVANVEIVYPYPALFPDDYILSPSVRLDLYRRLSEASSTDVITDVSVEIRDRFGPIPAEAQSILNISKIRVLCSCLGFSKCLFREKSLQFLLHENHPYASVQEFFSRVQSVCRDLHLQYKYSPGTTLTLTLFCRQAPGLAAALEFLDKLGDAVKLCC